MKENKEKIYFSNTKRKKSNSRKILSNKISRINYNLLKTAI